MICPVCNNETETFICGCSVAETNRGEKIVAWAGSALKTGIGLSVETVNVCPNCFSKRIDTVDPDEPGLLEIVKTMIQTRPDSNILNITNDAKSLLWHLENI